MALTCKHYKNVKIILIVLTLKLGLIHEYFLQYIAILVPKFRFKIDTAVIKYVYSLIYFITWDIEPINTYLYAISV